MRELDVLVAIHVLGWGWVLDAKNCRHIVPSNGIGVKANGTEAVADSGTALLPHYSTELNPCFYAVRKSGLRLILTTNSAGCEAIFYQLDDESERARASGEQGKEAEIICLAMLKAIGVEVQP